MTITEFNCSTCIGCYEEDTEFCQKECNFCLWSPKREFQDEFCFDCPMWATLGPYPGDNTPPYKKCVRHSEPCWKNPHHNNMNNWDEFIQEYPKRFIRRTPELQEELDTLEEGNIPYEKCIICEGVYRNAYICPMCEARIYHWYNTRHDGSIPEGWIEDINKYPIVEKNLKLFKVICENRHINCDDVITRLGK